MSTCTPPVKKPPLPDVFLLKTPITCPRACGANFISARLPSLFLFHFSLLCVCVSLLPRHTSASLPYCSPQTYMKHNGNLTQLNTDRGSFNSQTERFPIPLMYNGWGESLALLFGNLNQNPECWMKKWEGKMNLRRSKRDLMITANTPFTATLCSNHHSVSL